MEDATELRPVLEDKSEEDGSEAPLLWEWDCIAEVLLTTPALDDKDNTEDRAML